MERTKQREATVVLNTALDTLKTKNNTIASDQMTNGQLVRPTRNKNRLKIELIQ